MAVDILYVGGLNSYGLSEECCAWFVVDWYV